MKSDFVLDCSLTMAWCFGDEACPVYNELQDWLVEGQRAFAPMLWPLEVGNVLLVAERRKRITASASARFLAILAALPIEVESRTISLSIGNTLGLAKQYGLALYDTTYLELAMRLGLPLATLDKGLRKAATAAGVLLLPASLPGSRKPE